MIASQDHSGGAADQRTGAHDGRRLASRASGALPVLVRGTPTWLIFAGAFLFLFLLMDRQIDIYDEGFMLVAAMRLTAGDLVHRDFYYLYGPANPWILATLWQIFTPTVFIGRIYGLLIQAGIVAGCFHLLKPVTSWAICVLCSLATLLWMAALQNHLYPSFPCILLFILASIALRGRDPFRPTALSVVVAGGCAGLATLFRYDAGVAIGVAEGAYLAVLARIPARDQSSLTMTLHRFVLLGVAFAAIVCPLVIVYWHVGAENAWWRDIITSATTFYVSHRGLPFPSLTEALRRPSIGSAYLPILALGVGLATWAARPSTRRASDGSEAGAVAAALLMACLTAAMYYKGVVRVQPLHFVMSIIPATLLLAFCATAWQRGRGTKAATIAVGLLMIVPPAHALGSALKRSTPEPGRIMAGWLLGPRTAPPVPGVDRAAAARLDGVRMDQGQVAASAFVRRRTCPGERVFVGATRHDRFFINNVALYFAMDRLPATHWHTFDPGLQTRADIQNAIVRDLVRNRVRWIVRDASKDQVSEPNASSVSSGVTILDRWIAGRFHMVRRFGPASIWLRDGDPGSPVDQRQATCPQSVAGD